MATLKAFDGGLYEVPDDQAQLAISEGWTQATPEEIQAYDADKKYGNRPVSAFVTSAAREVSFSGSDWLLPRLGLYSAEELQGLKDAPSNQEANALGSIGGFGLGLTFKGPLQLLGKTGQLAARGTQALVGTGAKSLVGKAVQKALPYAVAGGIEGTAFGLKAASTEEALNGDLELTGEQIFSHASDGFLSGVIASPLAAVFDTAIGNAVRGAREVTAERAARAAAAPPRMGVAEPAPAAAGAARQGMPGPGDVPSMARKFDETATRLVGKHADTINDIAEKMGLGRLTPEEMVLRDLDIKKAGAKRLRRKDILVDAPRELLDDPAYATARTPDEKLGVVTARKQSALDAMDRGIAVFDASASRAERISGEQVAERVRREVIGPLKEGTTLYEPIVTRLEKEAEKIAELGQATLSRAQDYRRKLDKFLRWKSVANEQPEMIEALRGARGILQSSIRETAEKIASRTGQLDEFSAWDAGMKSYGRMNELEDIIEERLFDAKLSNRVISLTDNIWGAGSQAVGVVGSLLTGNPLPLLLPAGAMMTNKWARERLPHVMALALDRAAKKGTAEAVTATAFQRAVKKAVEVDDLAAGKAAAAKVSVGEPLITPPPAPPMPAELVTPGAATPAPVPGTAGTSVTAPPPAPHVPESTLPQSRFGRFRDVLSGAAEKGAGPLLATHVMLLATQPDYAETLQAAGLLSESPDEDDRSFIQAAGLAAVAATAEERERELDDQVAGFLAKTRGSRPKEIRIAPREYREHLQGLTQLVTNPQAMAARATAGGELSTVAPSVAVQVTATASRAAQYLHQVAPKPPPPSPLPGHASDWQPGAFELARYQRHARAVLHPSSVLEDMRRGALSHEAAEALRAVYPRMAEMMGRRFLDQIAERGAKLGYQQRLQLSVLMGRPLDSSLEPAMLASYQQTYQAARHAATQAAVQSSRVAGRKVNLPSYGSPSQSLEERANAPR